KYPHATLRQAMVDRARNAVLPSRCYLRWPSFRFAFRPFAPPCREKTSPASGGRETSRAPFANTAACPIWKSPSPNTPGLSREKYLRGPHPESNRSFLAATAAGSQEMVRDVWTARQSAPGKRLNRRQDRTLRSLARRKPDGRRDPRR